MSQETTRSPATKALAVATFAFCLCLPITVAGMNIAAGLMTAALLWAALAQGDVRWRAPLGAPGYALAAYFAVAVLVSAMAVDTSRCWPDLQRDLHKLWIFWLLMTALSARPSPRSHWALAAGFVFISGVGIFQALTQKVGDGVAIADMTRMRAHGFVHAVTYGQQMTLAILGGLSFLGRPGEDAAGKTRARATLGFLAVVLTALVFSQTRGAFIALAAGFAAICLVDKGFRRYGYWALALAVVGLVLLEILPGRNRSIVGSLLKDGLFKGDNNLNPQFHRFILWEVAFKIFKDYPFLGIGLGNYKTAFVTYFQGKVDGQWVWHSAHNIYFHQLAERGLAGLAALLALLGVLTARAYRRFKESPTATNLWAWAAMVSFLVMNLTEAAFQVELLATLVLFIWTWAEANHKPPEAGGG